MKSISFANSSAYFRFPTAFCPEGWYTTGDDCIKVIDMPSSITYDEAVARCAESGAVLTEPKNDQTMENIGNVLGNYTGNSSSFWVGK